MQVRTPWILLPTVWPPPLSLATTRGISVDVFSSPYLDVSVQAVPLIYLCIQYMMHESSSCGLLHSEICGSKLAYSSPQLIAVNHVLHRLPMPRHSPCAFVCFTFRALCSPCVNYEFFWLLVVYPNQNFHSDVVFAFQIFSGIVVFLIFALHLLFSFQGTLSVLLRTDFRRRSLFSSNPF